MDNRRLLVAALLSVAVLLGWQILFPPPEPPAHPPAATQPAAGESAKPSAPASAAAATAAGSPAEPVAAVPGAAATGASDSAPAALEPIVAAGRHTIVLENDAVRAELDNQGAELVSFQIKGKNAEDGEPLELIQRRSRSAYPFALVQEDGSADPLDAVLFAFETEGRPAPTKVRFTYRGPEGAAEKEFTLLPDGRIEFGLTVTGGAGKGGVMLGPGIRVRTKEELDSRFNRRAAIWRSGGEIGQLEPRRAKEVVRLPAAGLDWVGLEDTYFLTAVLPGEGLSEVRLQPVVLDPVADNPRSFDAKPFASETELSAADKALPRDVRLVLVPGDGHLEVTTYWGAKQYDRLLGLGHGLEQTVQWGWLGVVAKPLLRSLQWVHAHVTPNYGWAIVLVTVALKIVLLPLSLASFKSMRKMQKLNPKMQAIRERYRPKLRDKNGRYNADAQRQMNEEVMALYRTEGVNPAGGCLPMLVQLPIFFGFYRVLYTAVELWQSPWQFWVHDLTAPDPYYVLPIVMGISQFAQQRMSPPSQDPMQKRMMQFLPVVFTFFSLTFPAGLVLYWLTNNVLSIGQQALYNRIQESHEQEAKAAEKAERAGRKGKK